METKAAGKKVMVTQGVDKDTFQIQVWQFHPGHTDDLVFTWKWWSTPE